jgi:hypothetical protein
MQKVKNFKKTSTNLENVIVLFSSLETFLTILREEKEFKNSEMEAIKMCGSNVCKKDLRRKKKRKLMYDESIENNTEFDGRQPFIVENYYIAIDILKANFERRRKLYAELSNQFGFLGNFSDLANEEIRNKAEQLLKSTKQIWTMHSLRNVSI